MAGKRKSGFGKKGSGAFYRLFLEVAVSLLAVVLISSSVLFEAVRRIIIDQGTQAALQSFSAVMQDFEEANTTANLLATQVMLDDVCSEMINAGPLWDANSIAVDRVRKQLSMYQYTNPSVDSLYLYNENVDLFVSSGNRFATVGKESFYDQTVVDILEHPENYDCKNLIRREMASKYPNLTDKTETVFSYVLFTRQGGGAVIVNLKLSDMAQKLLGGGMMEDSRVLILNGSECLADLQTAQLEETDALWDGLSELTASGEHYRELSADGSRYAVFCLHSDSSSWDYLKITKWDTLFSPLVSFRHWNFAVIGVVVLSVVLVALWHSLSFLRLQRRLEKNAAPPKASEVKQLRDGMLGDFLHNRKLFSREQLRGLLEHFGLSYRQGMRCSLVVLQIERYAEFQKKFGPKIADAVKFGFQNIFEETFGESVPLAGLINRDETLTFLLDVTGRDDVQALVRERFERFCENVSVYVPWDFFCAATEQGCPLEQLPEKNGQLKRRLAEGFFYPHNSCRFLGELIAEHSENADFQNKKADLLIRAARSGEDVRELFLSLTEQLSRCSMEQYMNVIVWIAITAVRSFPDVFSGGEELGALLAALAACGKKEETDELLLGLFERIRQSQEKDAARRGVTNRLDEVKRYIEEHYADPSLNPEKLGDVFGVSANYLGRLFRRDARMSIAECINEERLKRVLLELETSDRSVKEILEQSGFLSSNYFYTYFRKKYGMTPQRYREKHRQESAESDSASRP